MIKKLFKIILKILTLPFLLIKKLFVCFRIKRHNHFENYLNKISEWSSNNPDFEINATIEKDNYKIIVSRKEF